MIACYLSNISAKYYKNPPMLCRVIAKNVGDVFFETQCRNIYLLCGVNCIMLSATLWALGMSVTDRTDRQWTHF